MVSCLFFLSLRFEPIVTMRDFAVFPSRSLFTAKTEYWRDTERPIRSVLRKNYCVRAIFLMHWPISKVRDTKSWRNKQKNVNKKAAGVFLRFMEIHCNRPMWSRNTIRPIVCVTFVSHVIKKTFWCHTDLRSTATSIHVNGLTLCYNVHNNIDSCLLFTSVFSHFWLFLCGFTCAIYAESAVVMFIPFDRALKCRSLFLLPSFLCANDLTFWQIFFSNIHKIEVLSNPKNADIFPACRENVVTKRALEVHDACYFRMWV